MAELFLVAGLGNPGADYQQTRHHAGFMVLDELLRRHGADCKAWQNLGEYAKVCLQGKDVLFVKPLTYMNESGRMVSSLARFFKVPASHMLVCFDDVSLDMGHIRMRASGSAGGQRGMKNIIELMGTQDIARLRVGIGPKPARFDMADFVLSRFSRADMDVLTPALSKAADAVESWLANGLEKTMSRFNG